MSEQTQNTSTKSSFAADGPANTADGHMVDTPYEVAGTEAPKGNDAKPSVTTDPLGTSTAADAPAPAAESGADGKPDAGDAQKKDDVADEKAGAETPEDRKALEEQVSKATKEQAVQTLNDHGLDFKKFEAEYLANGGLSEESYAQLEKAGIGKNYVDAYIRGNEAILQQFVGEVYGMAGGQEEYSRMTKWAEANLPKDEIDAFNAVMQGGDKPTIKIAVSGLVARWQGAEGVEPQLVGGKSPAGGRVQSGYASAEEMVAAMRDPRYGKDSAYTREVERKTAVSTFW